MLWPKHFCMVNVTGGRCFNICSICFLGINHFSLQNTRAADPSYLGPEPHWISTSGAQCYIMVRLELDCILAGYLMNCSYEAFATIKPLPTSHYSQICWIGRSCFIYVEGGLFSNICELYKDPYLNIMPCWKWFKIYVVENCRSWSAIILHKNPRLFVVTKNFQVKNFWTWLIWSPMSS